MASTRLDQGAIAFPSAAPQPATLEFWIGIDIAAKTVDAAIDRARVPGGAEPEPFAALPTATFVRSQEGVREMIDWANRRIAERIPGQAQGHDRAAAKNAHPAPTVAIRTVMEATGRYGEELADWLAAENAALVPAVINPARASEFRRSLDPRHKRDATDARALARYGAQRAPAPLDPPEPWRRQLRDLSRYRETLAVQLGAARNRAKQQWASPFIAREIAREIERLERAVERVEKQMRRLIGQHTGLDLDVRRLDTIFGVGWLTAATVLAELGDLRRFRCPRQLTSFAGLAPRERTSGTSVRGRASISKIGNPHVRRILGIVAQVVARGRHALGEWYRLRVASGKNARQLLTALARKTLVTMRAVLVAERDWTPAAPPKASPTPAA